MAKNDLNNEFTLKQPSRECRLECQIEKPVLYKGSLDTAAMVWVLPYHKVLEITHL